MDTNKFDPLKYGATPVTSFTNKKPFNPIDYGATPVSEPTPPPAVKGGALGQLFTGSTQKFGKTIGESLAAPENAPKYSESLESHTKIQDSLLKAIKSKKALGQDTSRLEDALENHIGSTPKLKDFTGDVIDKTEGQVIGEGIGTGLEALSGGLLSGGAKTIASKELSTLGKFNQAGKIGAGYTALASGSTKMAEGGNAGEVATSAALGGLAGYGLGAGLGVAGLAATKLPGITKSLTPSSSKIMQRVARISKGKQAKFEQTAGESIGDYLTKRGIYGNVDELSQKLYTRFTSSKEAADKALASLPGRFQSRPVKTALDELVDREIRVSSPGAPSPDINRVRELSNKYETGGLTMSEINETKRLYERNIKLDFLRQNLPESVARANNIDNALRTWQFNQADKLGLKNLPGINKETRLAKQLLDDIGKEYSGAAGNNAVNLTDWILLSGGDPTAVSAFLVKKTLSSKGVQSKIAKLIGPKPSVGLPEAKFGETSGLPARIPGRDYQTAIPMRPASFIEPQATSASRTSYNPKTGTQYVRDVKTGKLEYINPTQTKPVSQLSPKTKVKKPLVNNIPQSSETEARKYKSAKEFVNSQEKVFRGGSSGFAPSERGAFKESGFSVARDIKTAKEYGKVSEGFISPDAKIKQLGKVMEDIDSKIAQAKKEGADAIEFSSYDSSGKLTNEILVLNPKIIQTKPQLTDIWERANKTKVKPPKTKGSIKLGPLIGGAGASGVVASQLPSTQTYVASKTEESPKVQYTQSKDLLTSKVRKDIAYRETRGEKDPYSATNKNSNGTSDYGKYQVNEQVLTTYGKKFLGKEITPDEFLKNPNLQEEFFDKAIEHLKSLGAKTPEVIMMLWHKGWSDVSSTRIQELKNNPAVQKYLNTK